MAFQMSILIGVNIKRIGHLGILTGNKGSWVCFQHFQCLNYLPRSLSTFGIIIRIHKECIEIYKPVMKGYLEELVVLVYKKDILVIAFGIQEVVISWPRF